MQQIRYGSVLLGRPIWFRAVQTVRSADSQWRRTRLTWVFWLVLDDSYYLAVRRHGCASSSHGWRPISIQNWTGPCEFVTSAWTFQPFLSRGEESKQIICVRIGQGIQKCLHKHFRIRRANLWFAESAFARQEWLWMLWQPIESDKSHVSHVRMSHWSQEQKEIVFCLTL